MPHYKIKIIAPTDRTTAQIDKLIYRTYAYYLQYPNGPFIYRRKAGRHKIYACMSPDHKRVIERVDKREIYAIFRAGIAAVNAQVVEYQKNNIVEDAESLPITSQ